MKFIFFGLHVFYCEMYLFCYIILVIMYRVGCGKSGANAKKGGVVRPLLLQLRDSHVVRGNTNGSSLPAGAVSFLLRLSSLPVSLLVYPRLIGNGKLEECYQLPLLPRWKAYELD
ncbi:hypothetical protein QVD17_41586 [Tagetes erecta]|uniref:Uncharacterized protein n=1 Tax=Tagetes erecta TaxID=13708 RepID=A0AAD8NFR6_TARER|nr:hypothetical protein QVD17_41586 [Tagetes erecta]